MLKAVEELFGVKVAKVNTISVRGRYRRQGMHAGYTAASKKAIVTLKPGLQGDRVLQQHGLIGLPPGKRRAHGPAEGPHMGI